MRLKVTDDLSLSVSEIEITAIRAQGPGGQNVNKVASAIHLRFDICASSLPDYCKQRLLALHDQRITREGVIVIKSQHGRSQQHSKDEALRRLVELIESSLAIPTVRLPTRPTRSSQRKRVDQKTGRGMLKRLRGKLTD